MGDLVTWRIYFQKNLLLEESKIDLALAPVSFHLASPIESEEIQLWFSPQKANGKAEWENGDGIRGYK